MPLKDVLSDNSEAALPKAFKEVVASSRCRNSSEIARWCEMNRFASATLATSLCLETICLSKKRYRQTISRLKRRTNITNEEDEAAKNETVKKGTRWDSVSTRAGGVRSGLSPDRGRGGVVRT